MQPLLWLRYIGDIFFIWSQWIRKIKINLWKNLLTLFPILGLHMSPIMDSMVQWKRYLISWPHGYFIRRKVENYLAYRYRTYKSTDCRQYLHYASSHLEHNKRSVGFSQTLRISRLCSEENDFKHKDRKWNLGFLRENNQRNLLRIKWGRLSFVKKE